MSRLRRWLIKKLGGHIEPLTPIQQQIQWTKTVQPQKIQAQISIAYMGGSAIDFEGYCKKQVAERLLQELERSDYIQWESEREIFEPKMTVRATLFVVDADRLGPILQFWGG